MAHFWGLSIGYQRFEHAFFTLQPEKYLGVKVYDLSSAKTATTKKSDVILWLDLRMTADQKFLVLPASAGQSELSLEKIGPEKFRGNKVNLYDLSYLRIYFPQAFLLEQFLAEFPEQRFILNLLDNATDIHTALIKTVSAYQPEKRLLIQSDIAIVGKSIKELEPLWLFGTSYPDLMKLLSFESIWLQTASPFHGDVFIAPMKVMNRPAFNRNIIDEVHRRQKRVFLGPLKSASEYDAARQVPAEAYIFENVDLLTGVLDQNPVQ